MKHKNPEAVSSQLLKLVRDVGTAQTKLFLSLGMFRQKNYAQLDSNGQELVRRLTFINDDLMKLTSDITTLERTIWNEED